VCLPEADYRMGSDEVKKGLFQMQVAQTHAQGLKREFKVVLSSRALFGQRRGLMIQSLEVIRRPSHVRQIFLGGRCRAA
jgi:hypothetical protein